MNGNMVENSQKNAMREVLRILLDLGMTYLRGEPPFGSLAFPDPYSRDLFNLHSEKEKNQYLKVQRMRIISARMGTGGDVVAQTKFFKDIDRRKGIYSKKIRSAWEKLLPRGGLHDTEPKVKPFDIKGLVKKELARREIDCTEYMGSPFEQPLFGWPKSTGRRPAFCKNIKGRLDHVFGFEIGTNPLLMMRFDYGIWLRRITDENEFWFCEVIFPVFINESFEYPVKTKDDAAGLIKDALEIFERIHKPIEEAVLEPLEKYGIV